VSSSNLYPKGMVDVFLVFWVVVLVSMLSKL
jgi:hypothetical protein